MMAMMRLDTNPGGFEQDDLFCGVNNENSDSDAGNG